jgi:hypothetical protein
MARSHRWTVLPETIREQDANRQTAALAGLTVALFLVVLSFYLIKHLHHTEVIEDCLLSGRNNCDILVANGR